MIKVMSFGFRHGMPHNVNTWFDVRNVPNPHNVAGIHNLTGLHKQVQSFVLKWPKAQVTLDAAMRAVTEDGATTVGFGCIGGRHRSVALAVELAKRLHAAGYEVDVYHREQSRW